MPSARAFLVDLSVPALISAHSHSSGNRAEVLRSGICGCFFCRIVFAPAEIREWAVNDDDTAMCPQCGLDAVLGDASGLPVQETSFLDAMHSYWFKGELTPT
jgi:hypothetical protein